MLTIFSYFHPESRISRGFADSGNCQYLFIQDSRSNIEVFPDSFLKENGTGL